MDVLVFVRGRAPQKFEVAKSLRSIRLPDVKADDTCSFLERPIHFYKGAGELYGLVFAISYDVVPGDNEIGNAILELGPVPVGRAEAGQHYPKHGYVTVGGKFIPAPEK